MMKALCTLVVLLGVCFGQLEVLPIIGPLTTNTKNQLWPRFSNGSISINEKELIIPNGSALYLQSRKSPFEKTNIELGKYKTTDFTAYELCINSEFFFCTIFANDGRYYLLRKSREGGEVLGPVLKQGHIERMLLLKNKSILATGIYRPSFAKYLAAHHDNTKFVQTPESIQKMASYYETEKAFTLAYFDMDLNLIDSANTIDRTGEDVRWLERLYVLHPVDLALDGEIFLIDNTEGYLIEVYDDAKKLKNSFRIENEHYVPLPAVLNKEKAKNLRQHAGSYSVLYTLYVKKGLIITGFFQNPIRGSEVEGPYYYDISTIGGVHVASGKMTYPIIAEDEGDKVFLYVVREGGWFEEDKIYFVGLTLQDILVGRAQKANVDKAIEWYISEQLDD